MFGVGLYGFLTYLSIIKSIMLQQPKENQMKYIRIFDYLPRDTKTVFATVVLSTLTFQIKQNDSKVPKASLPKPNVSAFNMLTAENLMHNTYVIKNFQSEVDKTNNAKNIGTDSLNNIVPIKSVESDSVKPATNIEKDVSNAGSEVKILASGKKVKYIYNDGTIEIREGGTLAWRNKNPGALRSSDKSVGKANRFAVFASEEEGMEAMKALLRGEKFCNLSLMAAVAKYAPPHENNTKKYQADLKRLTGLDLNLKLRDLTEEELDRVAQTIKKIEGWVPGKLTRIEAQKQIVDTLARQNVR